MSRVVTNAAQAGRGARWAGCEFVSAEDPDIPVGPAPSVTETTSAPVAIVRACHREFRHEQAVPLCRVIAVGSLQ